MDQLRSYLDEFPNGANAQVAQEGIVAIEREAAEARAATDRRARETAQWGAVAASTDKLAIQAFLQEWPDGEHATAARARIKELKRAPTRRWVFQGLGGAVGLATIGGATWVELLPGFALWRLLHDQSFRTFSNVRSGIISPDGRTVLAGGEGGWRGASATLKLYDVATGNDVRTFKGHSKPIVSVAFSPDGRTALSISQDRTLKLWDVATGNEVRTFVGWPDSWGDKPLDRYVDYNATLRTPAVGICRTVVMAGIRKRSH